MKTTRFLGLASVEPGAEAAACLAARFVELAALIAELARNQQSEQPTHSELEVSSNSPPRRCFIERNQLEFLNPIYDIRAAPRRGYATCVFYRFLCCRRDRDASV